jgi:hypothetical protein
MTPALSKAVVLVNVRFQFQSAFAHHALVRLVDALYSIFKFTVALRQSISTDGSVFGFQLGSPGKNWQSSETPISGVTISIPIILQTVNPAAITARVDQLGFAAP